MFKTIIPADVEVGKMHLDYKRTINFFESFASIKYTKEIETYNCNHTYQKSQKRTHNIGEDVRGNVKCVLFVTTNKIKKEKYYYICKNNFQ